MNHRILANLEPITLVGGGQVSETDLQDATAIGKTVVAADGGANTALAAGFMPRAVIGDFDSLDRETRAKLPDNCLHHVAEQDSTDFDKALRSISAPLILGVGFMGARIDHQLAALNVLVRNGDQRVVLLAETELLLHMPPRLALPLEAEDIVSFMPMRTVTGRSTGLEWPIDGIDFDPAGRIGTSNRALGPATFTFDGPGMIGIIPRSRLAVLTEAWLALSADVQWPARA